MIVSKRSVLILTGWAVFWAAGLGYFFYARYQAELKRERLVAAEAIKVAAEKEKQATEAAQRLKEKMEEQARRMVKLNETKTVDPTLTPEEESSPVGGLLGERPAPGEPVPPIIPAAEQYILQHTLTAISMDSTPYAVIDMHRYRVGDRIRLESDLVLTVAAIKDGFIVLLGGGHKFKMRLVSSN